MTIQKENFFDQFFVNIQIAIKLFRADLLSTNDFYIFSILLLQINSFQNLA